MKETNEHISWEPKLESRFSVEFPEKFYIKDYMIHEVGEIMHTVTGWAPIKITFTDTIQVSVTQCLFDMLEFYKNAKRDYCIYPMMKKLFTIKINQLDGTGTIVETWTIHVGDITNINFGEWSLNSDQHKHPYIVIQPLTCILNEN